MPALRAFWSPDWSCWDLFNTSFFEEWSYEILEVIYRTCCFPSICILSFCFFSYSTRIEFVQIQVSSFHLLSFSLFYLLHLQVKNPLNPRLISGKSLVSYFKYWQLEEAKLLRAQGQHESLAQKAINPAWAPRNLLDRLISQAFAAHQVKLVVSWAPPAKAPLRSISTVENLLREYKKRLILSHHPSTNSFI